jgi:hypothetical protein
VFELNAEDAVPTIPSVRELAPELAEIAVRFPDSQEAERARHRMSLLLSKQAAKGSRPQGGQPPSPHHEETVITVWMMAYAISKQIRQVREFIQKYEPDERQSLTKMNHSYPWVSKIIGTNCSEFLKHGNTQNALQLAGKLLGLSASKIQKVVYTPSLS